MGCNGTGMKKNQNLFGSIHVMKRQPERGGEGI
jgi:hypothetical protein